MGVRADGRSNLDSQGFVAVQGSVPEAFGSCTLVYGQESADSVTQIVCAIKAQVVKPIATQPQHGQISFFLESS